jgi:signal transduction histidine kinase
MSTVTHELRTPLTSIRAFSEILRDAPDAPVEDRRRFLGIVTKETERLTRLINQMLDMAKIESGNAEWRTSELDVAELVQECVESTGQLFREKGIALSVATAEGLPRVRADRDRLAQVVLNLLSNAVKFSAAQGGRVEVRVSTAPDGVRVDVADNGPGISPADHEIVFEKFRQGGDGVTGKPRGTGLGLPISKRIIEHFGGRLWVESDLGRGATFSFVLPVETPALAPGREPVGAAAGEGRR